MRRRVTISVSGMVGSGKTTTAARLAALLAEAGLSTAVLRFQSLPCFQLLGRPASLQSGSRSGRNSPAVLGPRWQGYRQRQLTPRAAAVYLARIAAFRAWQLGRAGADVQVLNRYFYDNVVHFELKRSSERRLLQLIQATMPSPDLAILTIATPEVIARRRPSYSPDYLDRVGPAYQKLPAIFPQLIVIRTDSLDDAELQVRQLVERVRTMSPPRRITS